MNMQMKRKVTKAGLDWTGGVVLVALMVWAGVGAVATVVAAFVGGCLSFGLAFFPLLLAGFLVFWLPLIVYNAILQKIVALADKWASREVEDPRMAKFHAQQKQQWQDFDRTWEAKRRMERQAKIASRVADRTWEAKRRMERQAKIASRVAVR